MSTDTGMQTPGADGLGGPAPPTVEAALPVLIVDDDAVARELFTLVFADAGIEAVSVVDGPSALDYVRDHDVSMVLLDQSMPGMTGTEVVERLRDDPRTRSLPAILVTATPDSADHVRGLDAGADHYLSKPVDHAELVAHVRAVLRGRAGEAEIRRVVDTANDAYIAWNASGCIIEWNARATTTFGWDRSEALGRTFASTVIAERNRASHEENMRQFFASGDTPLLGEWIELAGLHQNGREIPIEMTVWTVESQGRNSLHALLRDVSRRVELEAAFDQADTSTPAAASSPDVTTMSDASGMFYVAPACRVLFGYEPDQFIREFQTELVHPDDRDSVARAYRDALRTDGTLAISCRVRASDGHYVWVEARGRAAREQRGARGSVIETVWRDVSQHVLLAEEQARAAEALEASNVKLEETLEREHRVVEELQALDRVKTDFVSTVSHELRTPLTSIMGFIEILSDDAAVGADPGLHHAVEVIDRNTGRLLAMIEDLLLLSAVESGTLKVSPTPTRLAPLVDSVVSAMTPVADRQEIEISVALGHDVEILAEASQIDRVLLNLVSNAIKFTPAGGHVEITAVSEGDHVAITVGDDGMGIPEEEQPKLFERFSRASAANERAIQGSGLGLFIVSKIVTAHGGTVSLRSTPGQGTAVTFTVPRAPADMNSTPEQGL